MRGHLRQAGRNAALAAGFICTIGLLTSCAPPDRAAMLQQAASAGNPDAQAILASNKFDEAIDQRRDPAPEFAELLRLAEAGNLAAQVYYGQINLYGAGGENGIPRNFDVARTWLQKAADRRSPVALATLAYIYGAGAGVTADGAKAIGYAKTAADTGNGEGLVALGACYAKGWGTAKDPKVALDWYRKAAGKSEAVGMRAIGTAYREGYGVAPDKVMAMSWYMVANSHARTYAENTEAARLIGEMAIVMLPEERSQAVTIANAWKPGSDLIAERQTIKATAPTTASIAANATKNVDYVTNATTENMSAEKMRESDIAMRDLKNYVRFDVSSDGSHVVTVHTERKILKEGAISEAGQMPLQFNSTFDQVEVTEAYTLKADGSRLPVSPSAIYEQPVPNAPTAPTFNDQRMKVIVFPNIAVGDTLIATTKTVSKPLIPGMFSLSNYFPRTYAVNELRLIVTVPSTMPLMTENYAVDFKTTSGGGNITYEWAYHNPKPLLEQVIALDPFDRLPHLFASSMSGYPEFARIYTEAVESKMTVTPKLQKLADEITAGTSDKRKQAALLHDWISRNIRYVAVALGNGSIIPHDADSVYDARYGDCKDQSALMVTLLKAKGIDAQIALINLGNSYTLPSPPTFGTFNHAITYIPSLDTFTDTTASTAQFGVLTFGEYGKTVIIATKSGQVLRKTPVLKTASATLTTTTYATLSAQGSVSGTTTITGTGPFSSDMRAAAKTIQSNGPEQTAKQILKGMDEEGEGTFQISSPYENGNSYAVSGTFKLANNLSYLSGNGFGLPNGLNFAARPGDTLLGPLNFFDLNGDEPTPCYGGKIVEEKVLTLPAGYKPRQLPKPFTIKNAVLQYSSVWTASAGKVSNRREFVSLVNQPVCIGETRRIAAGALNDIRGDYNNSVSLVQ